MFFKNSFEQNHALQYVYEHLQLTSSLGRKHLLNLRFFTDPVQLEREFDLVEAVRKFAQDDEYRRSITHIRTHLHQINDITPTLNALKEGTVLDDIQLFEIKKAAIMTQRIDTALRAIGCTLFPLEEMEPVVALLDPEHTQMPHFYIYAAYDPELAKWRERIQSAQDIQEAETYRFQAQRVEDKVRAYLTGALQPHHTALQCNLDTLAHLDIVLAKAKLALEWNACRPVIGTETRLTQLFNPEVAQLLKEKGRNFQPLDIRFGQECILVTGANMAGKSILLKTLSLSQYLFQFGFFVPAQEAVMTLFDEIHSSIGDQQSEASGLSSFAVEILTIDNIIKTAKSGNRVLALVDELARTTNPEEGKRLVGNFVSLAARTGVTAVVTTHYNGIQSNCRRLRVKGLQLQPGQVITPGNIGDFMDYALVETEADEVPMEAFAIARLFGVDEELLQNHWD